MLRPSAPSAHPEVMQRKLRILIATLASLLSAAPVRADDAVFLTLLDGDAELAARFPGEVVEQLWRAAELRIRRCDAGAADPAWLQRVEVVADDARLRTEIAEAGRRYLHEGALEALAAAGLDQALLATFRERAAAVDQTQVDYRSCRGFLTVLQSVYDRPQPGQATPAVVGTVCGQVELLAACHGRLPDAAATIVPDGDHD